jgi:hypothetical protein
MTIQMTYMTPQGWVTSVPSNVWRSAILEPARRVPRQLG